MIVKWSKFIGVFLMLFAFLAGTIQVTYASVNMEELREKFSEETGKDWSKVTSKERRDFMYKIRGRKIKAERKARVKGVETPYYIREGYRKEYQMEWEDATELEQELFIKKYKVLKIRWDREEAKIIRDEDHRLKAIEREREQTKRDLKLKKERREREAKAKQRELERKRKEEKRRLEAAQKKRNALAVRLRQLRQQRSR